MKTTVIAIFDIGKTNKKLLLFDQQYQVVYEESIQIDEAKDDDDFPCEDLAELSAWVLKKFAEVSVSPLYNVTAVNFSAYGASFVLLNEDLEPVAPLYNYLKPYPEKLKKKFYDDYGGESLIARQTASPVLGNLNSGMQLYRLKYTKPEIFDRIRYAVHLPQYLSYLITGIVCSDITSVGCHTNLWNFQKNDYHDWVRKENVLDKLPPLKDHREYARSTDPGEGYTAGIGLHDSSAALIPYLAAFNEPFILLSTGTWCISMNPFNHSLLTDYELHQDCLCYLTYEGKPVKSSRLFAGYEHEQEIKRLAAHFDKPVDYYKTVIYDRDKIKQLQEKHSTPQLGGETAMVGSSSFGKKSLEKFGSYEDAYHQLILDIIYQQVKSTKIVLNEFPVNKIFVDGGFGKNPVYMNLLASSFPAIEVYAATVAQASALGAALAIHRAWNTTTFPQHLIDLKRYTAKNIVAS